MKLVGQLFGALLLAGIVLHFLSWILGAAVLVGVIYVIRQIVREDRAEWARWKAHEAAIAARADQQHNWVLQGDDRGVYGPAGAALMHEIQRAGIPH